MENGFELKDPRVYFAAERTLLAWVRTGISLIGLGFVVVQFTILLQQRSLDSSLLVSTRASPHVGVMFVFIGALMSGFAARQHHTYTKGMDPSQHPAAYSLKAPIIFASSVSIAGICLGAYIAWFLYQ